MNRSLIGGWFRVVLAFVLVVYGMPASAAEGPDESESFYFQNGEDVYHVDYSELLNRTREVLAGAGELSVIVKRARPGSRDEVVRWSLAGTVSSVTSTYEIGLDTMTMTVPRELLGEADADLDGLFATVEVNGYRTEIDAAVIRGLASGSVPEAAGAADAFEGLEGAFFDLPRFLNGVTGFLITELKAAGEDRLQPISGGDVLAAPSTCVPSCTTCAGALLSNIAIYFALVSSCGGALVTGGASLVACIGVFIGLEASHLLLMGACGACYSCVNPPSPTPPPDPDPCPCEGEPVCDCGPGQG